VLTLAQLIPDIFPPVRSMKIIRKLFSFSGRAKRAKLFQFIPLALIVWFLAAYIDEVYLAPNLCIINEDWICYLPGEVREGVTLDKIISVLLLIPLFSIMVRRLHDRDRSGLWSLLAVPGLFWLATFLYWPEFQTPLWLLAFAVLAFLPLAFWFATKGDKAPNRFG
jgi:uncharacterized membrane protein YhaH (DUF805 family)